MTHTEDTQDDTAHSDDAYDYLADVKHQIEAIHTAQAYFQAQIDTLLAGFEMDRENGVESSFASRYIYSALMRGMQSLDEEEGNYVMQEYAYTLGQEGQAHE